MRKAWVVLVVGLGGCVAGDKAPPDVMPQATASIEVSSGGMLGQSTTMIYGDDRVMVSRFDYGRAVPAVTQVVPGAFGRAAAVIGAEGRRAKAGLRPAAEICMDYGTDTVRASPPIGGFDLVTTACPDAGVTALIGHVLAALR